MSADLNGSPAPGVAVGTDDLSDVILGSPGFPSANLLPPAIVTHRQVAAAKRRALLWVGVVLALLVLGFLLASLQQRSANAARDQAQARVDAALVEKQRYAYVPAVYQAVTTARKDLATAMGQEVQMSRLMAGLSAMQPPGLSLTSFTATVGPGASDDLGTAQAVIPGVGAVTMDGEAESLDLIAAWLERLRANPDYESPILTGVTRSPDGLYTFTASASLTEQALSGRFVEETG